MYYIARISGGKASAVAADMAISRYGRKNVWLRFEDTLAEDPDLYRFLDDCMRRWGGKLYRGCDGRTPLQVAEERMIIPNSAMAPCSFELKIQPFGAWLWRVPKPVTVLSGLGWQEPQRINRIMRWHRHRQKWRRPQGFARLIPGVYEDFPLLWKPIDFRPLDDIIHSWGIEIPALYLSGMPHNNCGGACVRQGISEWVRLLHTYPERFDAASAWEQAQRAKGGPRANAAFCRSRIGGVSVPLTLEEVRKTAMPPEQIALFTDDREACFCTDEQDSE